uniref:Uncharacterized protein n=1 Tax=Anguilla anguilla TaxID=7936 RepID=A0A0E9RW13_ANGAN
MEGHVILRTPNSDSRTPGSCAVSYFPLTHWGVEFIVET